jgi:hypothetical protein
MSQEIKNIEWIFKLKSKVPALLEKLKSHQKKGFFHYSLSGDLYSERENWGLGNTVFAAKIYYTLDMIDSLPENEIGGIIRFIKGFQKSDGSLYDPLISKKVSFLNRLDIKNLNFSNFMGQQTKRAETRQALSALQLLHSRPDIPYLQIPYTLEGINKYLSSLDWAKPYGAGSHFSHLLFFLQINKELFHIHYEFTGDLIGYAIDWVNKLQSPEDGSWYQGRNVPIPQKINGAMKVITGLKAVGKPSFKYPEKLIDLCLLTPELDHACNNLDAIYVVHYANRILESRYRYKDIQEFCFRWLDSCHEHYFPDIGGFSFYKGKANQYYYGAKITRGLNEPDIHGTVLLLWGIALISQILSINGELGFKEFNA